MLSRFAIEITWLYQKLFGVHNEKAIISEDPRARKILGATKDSHIVKFIARTESF